MALRTCRECGQSVSTSAKKCPHCGARNPALSKSFLIFVVVFALIVYIFLIGQISSPSGSRRSTSSNTCYYCGGSGWVSNGSVPKDALDFALNHKTCPKCNGSGTR